MENVDSWNKIFCECFVTTLGLIRGGYLSSKNGEYRIRESRRIVSSLARGCEVMSFGLFPCLLLVSSESSVENGIEI